MQKFRSHKSRLISSKRDSQKIDRLDLLTLNGQQHSKNNCFNVTGLINRKLHTITEENYKIRECHDLIKDDWISQLTHSVSQQSKENQVTAVSQSNQPFQPNDTFKSDNTNTTSGSEHNLLQNILSLMKTINTLQQKCPPASKGNDTIKKEIKDKLTQFKQLMGQFENEYQMNVFDFHNEDTQKQGQLPSFNSRSSQEASPQNTDRVAYQMDQKQIMQKTQEIETYIQNKFEINCHRVTESTQSLDTFSQDAQKDYYNTELFLSMKDNEHQKEVYQEEQQNGEQKQDKQLNESSIIHLFSYQKDRCIQSPLPSITQRSSEYFSPDTKYPANQLFTQSLEYKKIFYLLQTTEKKKNVPNTTNKHQMSEFQISNRTNGSNSKNTNQNENSDRNRSHNQLKGMINRLQTKYKRSVKKDKQPTTTSKPKYLTLNSKGFKQRRQC